MQRIATITLLLATLAPAAHAVPFLETGDAGHLIGTAQTVGGGFDGISGELAGTPVFPTTGDIDVFRLTLGAGVFTATVTTTDSFDSALVLFDAMGIGLRGDDDSGSGLNAQVSETLAAGVYYLAIFPLSNYFSPTSAGGNIWTDLVGDVNTTPDGPGAASPWTGWVERGFGLQVGSGTYSLAFNQTTLAPAVVPEPATLALLGFGLAGIAGLRRRA